MSLAIILHQKDSINHPPLAFSHTLPAPDRVRTGVEPFLITATCPIRIRKANEIQTSGDIHDTTLVIRREVAQYMLRHTQSATYRLAYTF
jgi:hypothetical protein